MGDTEICRTCPGLDEDLFVNAEAEAFVKWHAGQLSWAAAIRDRRMQLHGPSWLVRAFPWNARSMFAHIKPALPSAASSAGIQASARLGGSRLRTVGARFAPKRGHFGDSRLAERD
jgi:hypothetical protein